MTRVPFPPQVGWRNQIDYGVQTVLRCWEHYPTERLEVARRVYRFVLDRLLPQAHTATEGAVGKSAQWEELIKRTPP